MNVFQTVAAQTPLLLCVATTALRTPTNVMRTAIMWRRSSVQTTAISAQVSELAVRPTSLPSTDDDTQCSLPSECAKCVPSMFGPTCCGLGASWHGRCGHADDPSFEHAWDEGLEVCEPTTTTTTPTIIVTYLTPEPGERMYHFYCRW